MGVTNKTISRWETGTSLPPAESLETLSEFYGVTINEILSGQRLEASQYQQMAEENITAVMKRGNYSKCEKLLLLGEWLSKKWWLVLLCLAPSFLGYSLIPFVISKHIDAVLNATSLLIVGLVLICNHIASHFAEFAYATTPAGTLDGYAISSMFYDILIPDHGNYLDNYWVALKCALWQCFAAIVVNIDLAILCMKRK